MFYNSIDTYMKWCNAFVFWSSEITNIFSVILNKALLLKKQDTKIHNFIAKYMKAPKAPKIPEILNGATKLGVFWPYYRHPSEDELRKFRNKIRRELAATKRIVSKCNTVFIT